MIEMHNIYPCLDLKFKMDKIAAPFTDNPDEERASKPYSVRQNLFSGSQDSSSSSGFNESEAHASEEHASVSRGVKADNTDVTFFRRSWIEFMYIIFIKVFLQFFLLLCFYVLFLFYLCFLSCNIQ